MSKNLVIKDDESKFLEGTMNDHLNELGIDISEEKLLEIEKARSESVAKFEEARHKVIVSEIKRIKNNSLYLNISLGTIAVGSLLTLGRMITSQKNTDFINQIPRKKV